MGVQDVLLLIDDAEGRLEASRRGIRNTGTLWVLRAAATRNLAPQFGARDQTPASAAAILMPCDSPRLLPALPF